MASNGFYQPGGWVTPNTPRTALYPAERKPDPVPGFCTMELKTLLTLAANIEAAVKASREGQVSDTHGDPLDFILKSTENLRQIAIQSASR